MAHDGGMRMYHIEDPNEMTPEQISNEIAVILSKGYIRLKQRQLSESKDDSDNSDVLDVPNVSLDSLADQSAHGHRS